MTLRGPIITKRVIAGNQLHWLRRTKMQQTATQHTMLPQITVHRVKDSLACMPSLACRGRVTLLALHASRCLLRGTTLHCRHFKRPHCNMDGLITALAALLRHPKSKCSCCQQ
jgi:hypothetical protein